VQKYLHYTNIVIFVLGYFILTHRIYCVKDNWYVACNMWKFFTILG